MYYRKAGGRPKKKQRVTGCPGYVTKHLHTVSSTRYRSLAPLTRDRFLPTSQGGVCIDDLTCKSCHNVLDEVLKFPCKHLICLSCTLSLLQDNFIAITCPECESKHDIVVSSFSAPSPLIVKLLSNWLSTVKRKVGCLSRGSAGTPCKYIIANRRLISGPQLPSSKSSNSPSYTS